MPAGSPAAASAGATRVGDDRLGRAERVGADAQHDRVAGAQHAGGVGEHVGPALEDEPDDAERRAAGLDASSRRARRVPTGASRRSGESPPAAQAGDHVAAHRSRQHEPGRRAPRPLGRLRRRRRWRRAIVPTTSSSARRAANPSKNAVICSSAHRAERGERRPRRAPSPSAAMACSAAGTCSRSPVSPDDDQAVAGAERVGQLGADGDVRGRRRRSTTWPATRRSRASGSAIGAERTGVIDMERRPAGSTSASCCRGRDFAVDDPIAAQMVNFVYAIGDRDDRRVRAGRSGLRRRRAASTLVDADGMHVAGVLATHYHPDHVGGSMMGHHDRGRRRPARAGAVPDPRAARRGAVGARARSACRRPSSSATSRATWSRSARSRSTLLHTPGHTPGSQCFLVDGSWSPATRCSSTAAAAPTCPAATRADVRQPPAPGRAARRHGRLPRPPLLAAVERHDGGGRAAELRVPAAVEGRSG